MIIINKKNYKKYRSKLKKIYHNKKNVNYLYNLLEKFVILFLIGFNVIVVCLLIYLVKNNIK